MVAPQKNTAAGDKRVEAMEETMGKVLDEQQQQKMVNQQHARALDDVKIIQNEVIRRLDQMMAKLDKGKDPLEPNSGTTTPNSNPVNRNIGVEKAGGSGSGQGGSGLVFGTFDGAHQGGGGRYEYRHRKIDMPLFDGTDPDGWILQAERYFAIYQLINEEKIEAAVLSLSGDALSWFRWSDKQQRVATWEEMKALFLKKFRPILGGDLYEQWSALEQTGTTVEYIRRFVDLAAPLEGVSERVALASFIKGLKPAIKNEIRLWAPQDLGRAMDLAQQIEEKNRALKVSGFGSLGFKSGASGQSRGYGGLTGNTTQPSNIRTTTAFSKRSEEDRTLTEAQIADKRSRGLCYKCDEKWHKGHRCRTQINVILIDEEEEETEAKEGDELLTTEEAPEVTNLVEISLDSVAGLVTPKTMKLIGQIGDQAVVTLIDPGATHNFITTKLVKDLNIPVNDTDPYGVRMGTGDHETGRGICKGLLLQLQNLDIVEDFLPL